MDVPGEMLKEYGAWKALPVKVLSFGGTAFQAEAIPRDITGYMGAKRTCARFLRCGLPGHVASFPDFANASPSQKINLS